MPSERETAPSEAVGCQSGRSDGDPMTTEAGESQEVSTVKSENSGGSGSYSLSSMSDFDNWSESVNYSNADSDTPNPVRIRVHVV